MGRIRIGLFGALIMLHCAALGLYLWFDYSMDRFFTAVIEGKSGLVTSAKDWPRPLKELTASAADSQVALGSVDVYCLAKGMEIQYVWRMQSMPGLFELMSNDFELYPELPPREPMAFQGAPSWWSPQENERSQYFAGRCSNIGEKGDRFRVLLEEEQQQIYVYWRDNW